MAQTQRELRALAQAGKCSSESNWVCTFLLNCPIPLAFVAQALGGRTDHSVFPAVVIRMQNTSTVASIFNSSRVVMVGCKTQEHALLAAHQLAWDLYDKLALQACVTNFKTRNLVCRIELPYSLPPCTHPGEPMPETGGVNMWMLYHDLLVRDDVMTVCYRPDRFPGMRIQMCMPTPQQQAPPSRKRRRDVQKTVTFAIFERARGVATGLRGRDDMPVIDKMLRELPWCERGREWREHTEQDLAKIEAEKHRLAARKPKARNSLIN